MDRRTSMHVIAASSLALTGIASAQSYPQRPIRLVVGFSPGGSTDVAARRLGLKLANILGQPVVV
jgi:tripartite-type tricarboxylate transporter receptor subunit TctC